MYENFKTALLKATLVSALTIIVYQFFYIEFIRESVEDSAFDTVSWFALSKEKIETNSSNVFVLLVDDKYLRSENLLDENNETNYGYLMPREYIGKIINNVDALVEDIDEENYPSALFIDYDLSYLSDPHNKVASQDDTELLKIFAKKRKYKIYLPMTSNYNIAKEIESESLEFISVGLTSSSDGVSRRYYSYETYKDKNSSDKKFMNVAIELWLLQNNKDKNLTDDFTQTNQALIENRIIFKDTYKVEDHDKYTTWQSNWSKLSMLSANYPLDMVYEDDLSKSIIMVGPAHSASNDNFEIDAYSKEISGVEMHANSLMTLNYLDGKLKRLSLLWSSIIIFSIVFILDYLLSGFFESNRYKKFLKFKKSRKYEFSKKLMSIYLPDEKEEFNDKWLLLLALPILLTISYQFLASQEHYWFNWLIPALMSLPYVLFMGIKKLIWK